MTITVHVPTPIDPGRIHSVHALAGGLSHVVFIDAGGHYVGGTVMCDAEALWSLVEAAAVAEDALAAARSLA